MKAIRFPVMTEKEFVSVVLDCRILNFGEMSELMKFYNDVELTSPLPFIQTPRTDSTQLHQCYRFSNYKSPLTSWSYSGKADVIALSVDKSVKLHGIQHFGSEGGQYTVFIEVKDTTSNFILVKKTGSYSSLKDEKLGYYAFTVCFDPPLCLHESKRYEVRSLTTGSISWSGQGGKTFLECGQVQFNFYSSSSYNNGTNQSSGQFPAFIFTK